MENCDLNVRSAVYFQSLSVLEEVLLVGGPQEAVLQLHAVGPGDEVALVVEVAVETEAQGGGVVTAGGPGPEPRMAEAEVEGGVPLPVGRLRRRLFRLGRFGVGGRGFGGCLEDVVLRADARQGGQQDGGQGQQSLHGWYFRD